MLVKKLLKKRRDMTLFQKMIFFYVILLCIPTLLIGTFYIGNLSRRLKEEYNRGKAELLRQSIYSVENGLTRVSFCTSSFQYNAELLTYVDSYDFTSGAGAEMWLSSVRPAFEQIRFANPDFTNICIWRRYDKESNDPRYVKNGTQNLDLVDIEPMDYKTMKIFFGNVGKETQCRVYKGLFHVGRLNKVGYVEVDAGFDALFAPLGFPRKEERLFLIQGREKWQVLSDESGKVFLKKVGDSLPEAKNRISGQIATLGLELFYDYPDFAVLSNSTMLSLLVGGLFLFLFFSLVYYVFYLSVTRRIVNLTEHMRQDFGDRMEPYREDLNRDEIGVLTGVYNGMAERINLLHEEVLQKERSVNQAQYYAMQSQINPHFLYNTLENIDMLVEIGENEKASRMMAIFGKMLRYNLSHRRERSTVEEEISHVQDYLRLYSFRMGEDFRWEIEMEPACSKVVCPYCILQPVVENCFKHGFRDPEKAFFVGIRVFRQDVFVWIEIEDNGEGLTRERLEKVQESLEASVKRQESQESSIGLGNVRERIWLLCGLGSGLWIASQPQGCLVRIAIRI